MRFSRISFKVESGTFAVDVVIHREPMPAAGIMEPCIIVCRAGPAASSIATSPIASFPLPETASCTHLNDVAERIVGFVSPQLSNPRDIQRVYLLLHDATVDT